MRLLGYMKNVYRGATLGLLWLTFAVAALAADAPSATVSTRDTGVFMVAGALLILLGLIRKRVKD